MVMDLLGRHVPECEPELKFTGEKLAFMRSHAGERGMQPSGKLGVAVRIVAHLGGYRVRGRNSEPGHEIICHGQTRLNYATQGHAMGHSAGYAKGLSDGSRGNSDNNTLSLSRKLMVTR